MSYPILKEAWCFNCRRSVIAEEMVFASPGKYRKVCPDCFETITVARRAAKLKAKEAHEVRATGLA